MREAVIRDEEIEKAIPVEIADRMVPAPCDGAGGSELPRAVTMLDGKLCASGIHGSEIQMSISIEIIDPVGFFRISPAY